jgi:uncharacterized protein (DUF302 family)
MDTVNYAITKEYSGQFPDAVAGIIDSLNIEGFGILTQIDVQETLKRKLGIEYSKYMILGACNPPNAYKALKAEKEIGLLLPCNVIVYQDDKANKVNISVMKPTSALTLSANPEVAEIAKAVEVKLVKALENAVSKRKS